MAWFIKMDTIPGQSLQKDGYLDVLQWQNGADMPVYADSKTQGLRTGESNTRELLITVEAGPSAVELEKACLGGRKIASSVLEGYMDVDGKPTLHYKATYKDAVVSSVNYGGDSNHISSVSFTLKFNHVAKETNVIGKGNEVKAGPKLTFDAGKHELA